MADEKELTHEEMEALPLDEIRRRANALPPRDENGRFTKTAESTPTEPTEAAEEEEEKVFVVRREIDLGDGAGVQVFEGQGETQEAAYEAFADKLAEAQKNATRKIREQAATLKEYEAARKPKPKEITADEEYVYKQEFDKNPAAATRKIFKDLTGRDPEEVKALFEREDQRRQIEAQQTAANVFVQTHPDYVDNDRNTKLLLMQIRSEGLQVTSENLHKAYLSLKEGGLLDVKQEKQNSGQEPTQEPERRIAEPERVEVTTQRTRKASGLSTTSRPAARPSTEFSEDEAYNIPMDELRRRANAQLSGGR